MNLKGCCDDDPEAEDAKKVIAAARGLMKKIKTLKFKT
jgi:hypothetical protein